MPNAMGGVPGLTQEPIPPGGEFVHESVAGPAGTYMYHSRVGLQIDGGLIAPLTVEAADPGHSYDRDYDLVFDGHLHGHFFQAGGAVKVIVPAHMGRMSFDFLAGNPGRWLLHCHQIYHLESGLAREICYS